MTTTATTTTETNEEYLKRLLSYEEPRQLGAVVVGIGLAGGLVAAAIASWRKGAVAPIVIGVVVLALLGAWLRSKVLEARRERQKLCEGWRDIVWIYSTSITSSSGLSHSVSFRLASGARDFAVLPGPMSSSMWDELQSRFPSATFGFDPATEKRFAANPESLRVSARASASTPRSSRHPR